MLDLGLLVNFWFFSMAPDYPELERAKSQLFRWVLIVTRDIKELDICVHMPCMAYGGVISSTGSCQVRCDIPRRGNDLRIVACMIGRVQKLGPIAKHE